MFENKTVFITGGASGIGLLSGQCFAEQGANVVLLDLNKEALNKAVDGITAKGGKALGCVTDVTDYTQVAAARDRALEAFGTIDIVLPCAGGAEARIKGDGRDFPDQDIALFDFSVDLNLKAAVYAVHAALKPMREQQSGVIILLGSITGQEGSANNVGYAASKSALMNGLVKSFALEGAKYNVRAVCVAPGPVLTRPGMANMATLMGRAAETQEIVDLILYLASDKAAFITGTTVLIDGGRNVMSKRSYEKK